VAQNSAGSRSQHGRHPSPFETESSVTNGIDGAMDRMEPAPDSPIDGAAADPDRKQLPPRNHAVLPVRQIRDRPIR
jgi:hypothetical protein